MSSTGEKAAIGGMLLSNQKSFPWFIFVMSLITFIAVSLGNSVALIAVPAGSPQTSIANEFIISFVFRLLSLYNHLRSNLALDPHPHHLDLRLLYRFFVSFVFVLW